MQEITETHHPAPRGAIDASDNGVHRRLTTGYFTLEALNSVGAVYYFNYLFFYMREHFGFGNLNNLLLTALHGFVYMFSAWNAGRFGHKHGYFFTLRVGFSGMALALACGGLAPRILGYSHATLLIELALFVTWTTSMCLTWPSLQTLLSQHGTPGGFPRTAGIYNMVWAGAAAVANLTGGALLEKLGGEILFWLPAGLLLIQLALLARLQKMDAAAPAFQPVPDVEAGTLPALNPRPIAKARNFLLLAWLANPFAYIAINGILPVIPKLSERLELTPAYAGLVCSVWFWARLGAFVWFWLWPGWHYRFGWLLGAFLALIGSFTLLLLGSRIWVVITAQVAFGLAVGLIYYSSLFYSMDVGESKGKRGGIHEAAIGLGIFVGPAVGVTALHYFPGHLDVGTWAISGTLVFGLMGLLWLRFRKA